MFNFCVELGLLSCFMIRCGLPLMLTILVFYWAEWLWKKWDGRK